MKKPRPIPAEPSGPAFILTIDGMGGEGEGSARLDTGGRVHVALTLPGEVVRVRTAGDRTVLEEVLEASPDRVEAPCAHFGACGGCSLQHWALEPYLAWKVERLRATLAMERIETDILEPFLANPGTRRRVTLHARRGGAKGEAQLGFKARRSWDLVPITQCAIADPALVAALPALRRLALPFLESSKSAPALHVTLTITGLDIDVTGVEQKEVGLSADARMRVARMAAEDNIARVTLAGETLYQARQSVVRFGVARAPLPPGGFLQASAEAEAVMVKDACAALAGSRKIADLFCGAGAFTFPLATIAPVMAVDSAEGGVAAIRACIAGAPGLKTITPVVRDLFRRPYSNKELKGFDGVLFDPPRAGAAEQAAAIAASTVQKVVGVSCNPATFARDASLLIAGGFRLVHVRPVDQFLWSPHIELVGVFER